MSRLTILDTVTGMELPIDTPFDAWWWEAGNGSCDCNRAVHFVDDDEGCICLGARRYLIIESDFPGTTLRELNADYPEELLQSHGI